MTTRERAERIVTDAWHRSQEEVIARVAAALAAARQEGYEEGFKAGGEAADADYKWREG